MYNYCTLFDSNYLTRGLAMYESLKKHSDNFHLYIFAFNNLSYDLLKKLNLKFVTVISLKEFEDDELLKIKTTRSTGEYCWTCTPSIIKYSIKNYNLDNCTYLDADLYFYSNPCVLIQEMGNNSVLITEHRYTPEYDQSQTSGIYCVQFMTFKNDTKGMKVLNWWKDACNEWCYARYEDGKFGDQKYLDDWTTKFDGVHELQNLGGGVAPWNVQQYYIIDENNKIYGVNKSTNKKFELVFYHFHNYKILENNKIECGIYKLDKNDIKFLYKPYTQELDTITKKLNLVDGKNDYNGIVYKQKFHWKDPLRVLKRYIKNTYNIFDIKKLLGEK
jgi:hypothetical protein